MRSTFYLILGVLFQVLSLGQEGYCASPIDKSEARQLVSTFRSFSATNQTLSFEGSYFRKQKGKYRAGKTTDLQPFFEWAHTKFQLGKKPFQYPVIPKYETSNLPLYIAPSLLPAEILPTVSFSNCYGFLHFLFPF